MKLIPTKPALASACAGNPEPGESGYPYNLAGRYQAEFLVDGAPYRGTIDLSTAPGGAGGRGGSRRKSVLDLPDDGGSDNGGSGLPN